MGPPAQTPRHGVSPRFTRVGPKSRPSLCSSDASSEYNARPRRSGEQNPPVQTSTWREYGSIYGSPMGGMFCSLMPNNDRGGQYLALVDAPACRRTTLGKEVLEGREVLELPLGYAGLVSNISSAARCDVWFCKKRKRRALQRRLAMSELAAVPPPKPHETSKPPFPA